MNTRRVTSIVLTSLLTVGFLGAVWRFSQPLDREYAYRLIRWGQSNVQDYKRFPERPIGAAIDHGLIESVYDRMIDYLPELTGRGLDEMTIRDLLMMSSGIHYREDENWAVHQRVPAKRLVIVRFGEGTGKVNSYLDVLFSIEEMVPNPYN